MSLSTRRAAAGLVVAAGLAGTAVLAPPAQAAPGLTGKLAGFTASAFTDQPTKSVKAYCPPGKVVISGGGYVEGPSHVELTLLRPVQAGNYFEAAARNPWGRAPWRLSTYALCADQPPGLQYLTASSAPVAGDARTAVAACPAGTKLIGLGARAATEADRNVTLVQLTPSRGGLGAAVRSVAAQGGEADNWTVTAYAVCASVSTTVLTSASPSDSAGDKIVGSDCGPGGLAAVGGSIATGDGEAHFTVIYPDAWLQEGVVFAAEDHDGYAGSWAVRSVAICA